MNSHTEDLHNYEYEVLCCAVLKNAQVFDTFYESLYVIIVSFFPTRTDVIYIFDYIDLIIRDLWSRTKSPYLLAVGVNI